MYFEIHGQGDSLLLLHGFNVSGITWKAFIPYFSKTYQLIIPDLRGHGKTDNPPDRFSHRLVAEDISKLLDRLGVGKVKCIGTSTGGMALLHMALQQPDRVSDMVLVGSTHYYPESARAVMRRRTEDTLTPEIIEKLRQYHRLGNDQIRALHRHFHSFKDSQGDMDLTHAQLGAIKARTLIVHGDRDTFYPLSIPMEMYQSIPRAYLWVIPNGGHIPISECAPVFSRIALQFLRGDWERTQMPRTDV